MEKRVKNESSKVNLLAFFYCLHCDDCFAVEGLSGFRKGWPCYNCDHKAKRVSLALFRKWKIKKGHFSPVNNASKSYTLPPTFESKARINRGLRKESVKKRTSKS